MIKANELRIGNLVYNKNKNVNELVWRISEESINFIEDEFNGITFDKYEPIQLTEEILLKCGFEKALENNYHLGIVRIWHEPVNNRWFFFYDTSLRTELFGLHDLQNVYYFTHDKTELNVNL